MVQVCCRVAEARREIDDALRLRWAVFGEELGLLPARPTQREVDGDGQLGRGNTTNSPNPLQVLTLGNAVRIAAKGNHSLAIRTDGTMWAWGDNTYGQIGDGTTTDRTVVTQVASLSAPVGIASGIHHTIAVLPDGRVWTWGRNQQGQLGNGTFGARMSPPRSRPTSSRRDAIHLRLAGSTPPRSYSGQHATGFSRTVPPGW